MTPPAPPSHRSDCERAFDAACVCGCNALLHQSNILSWVLDPTRPGTASEVSHELEALYGSAFVDFADPTVAQVWRRRPWHPSPGAGKAASQREQRILDVTLRDILFNVFQIRKMGWLELADDLRVLSHWLTVVSKLETSLAAAGVVSKEATKGYFWSSMLAATSKVLASGAMPTVADIEMAAASSVILAPGTTDRTPGVPFFARMRSPRQSKANTINQGTVAGAVSCAATEIAAVLSSSTLPPSEMKMVLLVVGSTISPDLWHHPAAVKHLVLPAVALQRHRWGKTFSLDGNPAPGDLVEDLIEDELGSKWASWRGFGGSW